MVAETDWVIKLNKGFAKSVHSPDISLFQPFFVFSFPSFTIVSDQQRALFSLPLCCNKLLIWHHLDRFSFECLLLVLVLIIRNEIRILLKMFSYFNFSVWRFLLKLLQNLVDIDITFQELKVIDDIFCFEIVIFIFSC